MKKLSNAMVSKIWFLFLLTIVVSTLVLGTSTASFAQKKPVKGAAIVDINTADEKTLEALPGVGKATAKAIVAGRPYKNIDDLKRVKGMSDKKIQAIKDKVSVGGAAASTATAATAQKTTAAEKRAIEKTSKTASKMEGAAIVDINAADEKTLEGLPGVGKATAKAIVAGRPYKSIDDLKRVKGMSDKKIQAIKDKVSVGGATASTAAAPIAQKASAAEKKVADTSASAPQTAPSVQQSSTEKTSRAASKLAPGLRININTAAKQEIEALPGIGPVKAQAIIDGRPYQQPEDIMKVKGIKQKTFDKIKDNISVR
jgi:competence protein ComEA